MMNKMMGASHILIFLGLTLSAPVNVQGDTKGEKLLKEFDEEIFRKEMAWMRAHVNNFNMSHAKFSAPSILINSKVKTGKLSYRSIGTSKKEIEELLARHKKVVGKREEFNSCREMLIEMRSQAKDDSSHWNFFELDILIIRGYIRLGHVSLEELNTSEEELNKLLEVGRKRSKK